MKTVPSTLKTNNLQTFLETVWYGTSTGTMMMSTRKDLDLTMKYFSMISNEIVWFLSIESIINVCMLRRVAWDVTNLLQNMNVNLLLLCMKMIFLGVSF